MEESGATGRGNPSHHVRRTADTRRMKNGQLFALKGRRAVAMGAAKSGIPTGLSGSRGDSRRASTRAGREALIPPVALVP